MIIKALTKVCTKCKTEKSLLGFYKSKSTKSGYQRICKLCGKAVSAKYRSENPEKVKAGLAKYRTENPEKVKAGLAKYRTENPEKEKARKAKYYAENPEEEKARKAKYYAENPEKIKAMRAKYYAENHEKIKAKSDKYRAENHEKFKARNAKNCAGLSSSYIAATLKMPVSKAPPELIELKRTQLQLTRLTRDIKNEQRKSTSSTS